MGPIRNKVLIAIAAVFLFGPLVNGALAAAGVSLPSWLTAESAEYLTGTPRESTLAENANVEGYLSRGLQSSIESETGNNIPCKASVLMANAALQRATIAQASAPFGWECYPTFFNSAYGYVPRYDAVVALPGKRPGWLVDAERSFAQGVRDLARTYPSKRFVVLVPPMVNESKLNPSVALTADATTVDLTMQTLVGEGDVPDNLFFITPEYETADDYYVEYFRSDHHWNALGVERAFNMAADALGLGRLGPAERVDIEGLRYTGAYGRSGLVDVEEEVFDLVRDTSQIQVVSPEGERKPFGHEVFEESPPLRQRYSFYDTYYSFPYGGEVVNARGEGRALLLSDSFGAAFASWLAQSYASSFYYPQLQAASVESILDDDFRIARLVDELDCDDVYFVCHAANIANLMIQRPAYFE